ncbi:MAG: glycosyltransferase family 39 protein [Ignavibacteria bacterium]
MNKFIQKYWIHFNVLFIGVALIFQFVKAYKGHTLSDVHINVAGVVLLAVGIVTILYIFIIREKKSLISSLILLSVGYTLICFGYQKQKDPDLEWGGSDVAWYNYQAGEEVVKHGADYIISTWNTRANPFDTDSTDVFQSDAKEMFMKDVYKDYMKMFIGNRWDAKKLDINKGNNRPYMHPPLTPVTIGLWLEVFPYGRYSAQILMILLNVMVFSLIFAKYYKEGTNQFYVLFFAIVTTPAAILFMNPSAEQMAMMLLALSTGLLIHKDMNDSFYLPLVSGLIMGLAFYTKFIVAFYILFQIIALIISFRKKTFKPAIGYALGLFVVFLMFTLSGYYFWLTILTGKVVTELYIQANPPVTISQIALKLYYFGLPLIMIAAYMTYKIKSLSNRIVFIPLILGIVMYMGLTWKVGAFNRYLFIFVPAMFPFFYEAIKDIEFSKRDVIVVPIAGVLLLGLILYL